MKKYNCECVFITDYLQARFSENAKSELENYISQGIVKTKEDSWANLMYFDDNGIYIPSIQIRQSLLFAAKEFKQKKKRSNMVKWAESNIIIEPTNIYIKKGNEPDKILTSYPARKDGMRVTIKHPQINKNTKFNFVITIFDDEMEAEAIENLIKMSGKMYGIGARRRDMFGRYELLKMKKI